VRTEPRAAAKRVRELAQAHHAWRRETLNLGAAETLTSDLVREMLATDLSRRYVSESGAYSGARMAAEIEEIGGQLACELFGVGHALLEPISGHLAVLAVLVTLTEPGDTVMTVAPEDGGYPLVLAPRLGLRVVHHAFDRERFNLDVEATAQRIRSEAPRIVFFGASEILFPHPVAALMAACREVHAVVCYDAAHPLGLIAGGAFQDPVGDGVDIVVGSTNKSFFGPHRGIVLIRDDSDLRDRMLRAFQAPPLLQSSHHTGSAIALTIALAETIAFGRPYAAQVVANARALAAGLLDHGMDVVGAADGGSRSHQVLLNGPPFCAPASAALQRRLEQAGILADCVVRFGLQQVTRVGMGPDEMALIAKMIATIARARDSDAATIARVGQGVRDLVAGFPRLQFAFESRTEAYRYVPIADLEA
jgi:glycine hydroxymethyltransferase